MFSELLALGRSICGLGVCAVIGVFVWLLNMSEEEMLKTDPRRKWNEQNPWHK